MEQMTDIEALVCGTLATASKRDLQGFSAGTQLADLAIDSLSLTTLIAQLEAALSVQLSPDQKMAIYDADDIGAIVTVARGAVSGEAPA
jgi:acyl carrier protein